MKQRQPSVPFIFLPANVGETQTAAPFIATPAGDPGTPDQNVFFLATDAGTYTNYGGAVLDGAFLHILAWDGSAWSDTATDVPAGDLEDYAKKDGYYASLTAGAALNLVGR